MQQLERPWGYELIWAHTDKYIAKLLHIYAKSSTSLQYHRQKEETIYIQKGVIKMLIGENEHLEELILKSGQIQHIPPGCRHRFIAIEDVDIIEVSTSELDDVVRLEDDYGRI